MTTGVPTGAQAYSRRGKSDRQVDAAVAHRPAEVVVPVGAVDREAAGVIHRPRDIGKVVTRAAHAHGAVLAANGERAAPGRVRTDAARDGRRHDHSTILPRDQALLGQDDLDPLSAARRAGILLRRGAGSRDCGGRRAGHGQAAISTAAQTRITRLRRNPARLSAFIKTILPALSDCLVPDVARSRATSSSISAARRAHTHGSSSLMKHWMPSAMPCAACSGCSVNSLRSRFRKPVSMIAAGVCSSIS